MQPKIQDGQDSGGAQLDSQRPMNWRETTPGRYERNVDETETFYTVLARMYESTGYVELSVMIPEAKDHMQVEAQVEFALQEAWRRLRYEHPTIGASVEYDYTSKKCKKVYETFLSDEMARQSQAGWICRSKRSTTDALD